MKTMRRSHVRHYIALGALAFLVASCGEEEELTGYKPVTFKGPPPPVLENPGFEAGAKGWDLPNGYRIDPHGGRSGTAALFYERTDPSQYPLGNLPISVLPGQRYRFGAWIRCEDVKGKGDGATICLEFYDQKRYVSGNHPAGVIDTKDWTYIQGEVVAPERFTSCRFVLYLRQKMTGKVWFDDVRVEPVAPRVELNIVAPAFETVTPADGRIRVNAYIEDSKTNAREGEWRLYVKATAGTAVKTAGAPLNNHVAEVDLAGLPVGQASLRLLLLDPKNKLILAEKNAPLTIVATDRPTPKNVCRIDRRGRAIVDGKPYLPVGLYLSGLSTEELNPIAASPFNCVMPYESLRLSFSKERSLDTVRNVLDTCHAKGIKVIFSIKDVYDGTKWQVTDWMGTKGESSIVEKAVASFRDHPALLAWYINDELPAFMVDRLDARRRLVNKLDPFHPTWSVLYQFDDLPFYGSSCDVIGVDPYPIENAKSKDMARNDAAMNGVDQVGLPVWVVPQIFNWGAYKAEGNTERYKEEFRDPSEEEMRSMTLQLALRGAKGFVYYSYFDLKRPLDPKQFNPPPITQADFDRRWAEICRVGALLRELEPFLLADEDAPAVRVDVAKGLVQAREFRDKDGNVRLLVAAIGPGEADAVLTTTASMPLTSVYGHCTALGNGQYRFTGVDICSDILVGKR